MATSLKTRVDAFIAAGRFAVVGASTNREKYGNKVLRCYLQHGMQVVAVNPRADRVEGVACFPALVDIPAELAPLAVSVITPPAITEQVVLDAAAAGVKYLWMQPGAESARAVSLCDAHGIVCIPGTACLLVVLGYDDAL